MAFAFVLRLGQAGQPPEELGGGVFHAKCAGAERLKKLANVVRLALAHQAGIDIDAVDAFAAQCSQAQRVGDGGIDAAADEEEDVAITGLLANLGFDERDAIFRVPVGRAACDAEDEVRQNLAPAGSVDHFGMKLHGGDGPLAMRNGGNGARSRGCQYCQSLPARTRRGRDGSSRSAIRPPASLRRADARGRAKGVPFRTRPYRPSSRRRPARARSVAGHSRCREPRDRRSGYRDRSAGFRAHRRWQGRRR